MFPAIEIQGMFTSRYKKFCQSAPVVCIFFYLYCSWGKVNVVLSGTTRLMRERQQSAEGIYRAPKMEQAPLEVTESILTSTSFTAASLWGCFAPSCHFW